MAYHSLSTESGGDGDDRRAEADRILKILGACDSSLFSDAERAFVIGRRRGPVSVKQLFWLRDIKSKYAE